MIAHIILLMSLHAIPVLCADKGYDIRHPELLEELFYEEVVATTEQLSENPLCNLSMLQVGTFCKKLFNMDDYKYLWKIHLNVVTFHQNQSPECLPVQVTFQTTHESYQYPQNYFQNVVPCYGYHKPIRTNYLLDDYRYFLFVWVIPTRTLAYAFRRDLTKELDVYYVHERISLSDNKLKFSPLTISDADWTNSIVWSTIETRNYTSELVEAIYVRDMVLNNTPIQDQLFDLDVEELSTVCLSIFSEEKFQREGFLIDRNEMLSPGFKIKDNLVLFRYLPAHNGHQQFAFSCLGKHANGDVTDTQLMLHKWQISSGRRNKSIFIYEAHHFISAIIPKYYIENFDFDHLKPSQLSETEKYTSSYETPNTLNLLF